MYQQLPPHRVRAVAVENDNRLIGIGGLQFAPIGVQAFMDAAEGVDFAAHKRALIAGARQVMRMASERDVPVYASRDASHGRSESLLGHFGFKKIASDPQQGETWRWQTR